MTAVLQPTHAFRKDILMASLDENQINYSPSSTDWKAKYHEVADMLAETRAELDDFHHSSKELEEELERELERTEKSQRDLQAKVARAEHERDEWKGKFMSLQTTHNTTTTSLQRELDTLRQEHQSVKVQLRELEMGNDDLERNERAVSSSLADIEAKYSRALEEKILLEHELLDKASLEEECQRLRDELRDASVEASILKDQLVAAQSAQSRESTTTDTSAPSSIYPHVSLLGISDEDLLNTPPPPDMQVSDLLPSLPIVESPVIATPRQRPSSLESAKGQSTLLQRAGFQSGKSFIATPPGSSPFTRSGTLPSLSTPTRIPPRTPVSRPPVTARINSGMSTSSTNSIPGTTSRSKGVQMVSEMRARVRNLEQKIHTRVPRLRMGSVTVRPNTNQPSLPVTTNSNASASSTSSRSTSRSNANIADGRMGHRRSADDVTEHRKTTPAPDSSGWVLIMEDSPSPVKNKERERDRRKSSSPTAPTSYRPLASASTIPSVLDKDRSHTFNQSTMNGGIRRPQSRLSGASLSTVATTSSIPTPTSRPTTPTFLPLPSSGLYAHASTAGVSGLKRSTGPPGTQKRSSLGASTTPSSHPSPDEPYSYRDRPLTMPPPSRPGSGTPSSTTSSKYDDRAPKLPGLHTNVTLRSTTKLPTPGGGIPSVLSQSRIGRPSNSNGRRSTGAAEVIAEGNFLDPKKDEKVRPRSGSTAAMFGRNGP